MFKFRLPWSYSKAPEAPGDIPKSFTVASDKNELLRVSMEDSIADFVDIDYKKLTYAEVASLSRNKKQSSSVAPAPCEKHAPAVARARDEVLYPDTISDDIQEKVKVNNHFMKKVHKSSDRRKK